MTVFRLLVEGTDDLHLIRNLLRDRNVTITEREILDCGGIDTLLDSKLPEHVEYGTYDSLAIIADADIDVSARWQAIRQRLTNLGYRPPAELPADGLYLADRQPAIGVWLMPDNQSSGALEDFAQALIPSNDQLWPIAQAAVANIPAELRRFGAVRKAELHTFLAWQEHPGTPFGLALTRQYFLAHASAADAFVRFVDRVRNAA